RCASRWASRVLMVAASMVASICDRVMSASFRVSLPETPVNWPFTLEIIMCLTLNSATEWTGSMFQVETATLVSAAALMVCFLSREGMCHLPNTVMTIVVITDNVKRNLMSRYVADEEAFSWPELDGRCSRSGARESELNCGKAHPNNSLPTNEESLWRDHSS